MTKKKKEPNDEESADERSQVTRRSNRSESTAQGLYGPDQENEYQMLTEDLCGAIFSTVTRDQEFVCMNTKPCSRKKHRSGEDFGTTGSYYKLKKSSRNNLDGVLSTGKTHEEIQAKMDEEIAENHAKLEELGAQLTDSNSEGKSDLSEDDDASLYNFVKKEKSPKDSTQDGVTEEMKTLTAMVKRLETELAETKRVKTTKVTTTNSRARKPTHVYDSDETAKGHRHRRRSSSSSRSNRKRHHRTKREKRSGHKKKHRRHKHRGSSSESSWSDKSDTEDSTDSEDSEDPLFYAVFRGKEGMAKVYTNSHRAHKMITKKSLYKRFNTKRKARAWLDRLGYDREEEKKDGEDSSTPSVPPLCLSGKDPSTKDGREVFKVNLDLTVQSSPRL